MSKKVAIINISPSQILNGIKRAIRECNVMNPDSRLNNFMRDEEAMRKAIITFCPADKVTRIYYHEDHEYIEILGCIARNNP